MRHRLIAILLISAISLGMLIPGLSGVAKADTSEYIHDGILYWEDFKTYAFTCLSNPNQQGSLAAIFEQVEDSWDDPKFNCFIMADNSGNVTFMTAHNTETLWIWSYNYYTTNPHQYFLQTYNGSARNCYYNQFSWLHIQQDNVIGLNYGLNSGSFNCLDYRKTVAINLETEIRQNFYFPTPLEEAAGYQIFVLHDVYNDNRDGIQYYANIVNDSYQPPYINFNVVTFYVGERLYFTFKEQDIFRDIEPEHLDYMLGVFHDNSDTSELFTWEDVSLLPGAQQYIAVDWSHPSPMGIYAIDITFKNWVVIDMANLIAFDGDLNPSFVGFAINTPYRISDENPEPGTNGTPDSYTEVYNNWNTYISNYPNSSIVPQDLVPQFYNTQAASCKPCEVAPPSSLWNARHDVTSFGQDIFEYHFPLVTAPAYNYELFDVCVLSRQGIIGDVLQLDYTLYWWYSDSSTPQKTKIQDVNFDILMEMFDIIIVVDDPDYVLIESLPDGDVVYTGDYEYGFTYSSDAFTHGHVLYGFAFITEKAVQKQMLFNFNDGIRKTYDLMEQYIDKRGAWDNSFLDWTITLFNQYQTIYGKLDDIYDFLFNWDGIFKSISDKLDTLISNTDNSNPDPWYLSLWNFISQFSPSNSDFSSGLDEINTTFDDIPLLPEPSAAPTLPLIGG